MDPDSPLTRVERTLWSVWTYLTGAVNRFFRPQPANTVYNDPNSFQESAVDREPPNCGPAERDTGGGGADEEQPLATTSQLGSSRPVVVWELPTTDIDLKPDEESVRYKARLSRSSEGEESSDAEGTRGDAEDARAKEQEKPEIEKCCARDETPQDDERHVKTGSRILRDDAVSEDVEKNDGTGGDEEETVSTATPGEHQEIEETVTKIHIWEEEGEDMEKSRGRAGYEEETVSTAAPDEHQEIEETVTKTQVGEEGADIEESEGRAGYEEETVSTATPGEHQEIEETVTKIHIWEEEGEDMEKSRGRAGYEEETVSTAAPDEHQEIEETVTKTQVGEEGADIEESEGRAGYEEETVSTATPGEHQEIEETVTKTHVGEEEGEMHHEDEQDDTEVKLCTMMDSRPEEEDEMLRGEAGMQKDDAAPVVTEEEAEVCDVVLQLVTENKSDEETKQDENQLMVSQVVSDVSDDELVAVGKRESDECEDEGAKQDEREQGAAIEEEPNNEAAVTQTTDEVPEQEEIIRTVTDDSQVENILTVTCSEEAVQNTETWQHPAELTDEEEEEEEEEEDVAFTEVQTQTREADVAITCISLDDKGQAQEERLSSEVGNSDMEIAFTSTPVTVKPEGDTGQEVRGELGNIPPGISEGQVVVSQELNTPTCEETQEGVPGYNNELGPDENTTQRFLEVGDYEETQTTQLPEEVEGEEQESLQNRSTGADCSQATEPMEEKQEGTEDPETSFNLSVEEHTGIQHLTDTGLTQETEKPLAEGVIQELGHLFGGEGGKLLESSMKTEIKHISFTEETDSATEELQDVTEDLLVDFGIDGGVCDSKEAARDRAVAADEAIWFADESSELLEAELQKMTETIFSQESVHDAHTEQNSSRIPSLLEDINEFEFLKPLVEIEPNLLDDSSLEMYDAGIDVEEKGHGEEEEEEAEDEMHLEAGTAAELITEMKEKRTGPITESEFSQHLETRNQSPDRALEISMEEMIAEAADESKTAELKPKDSSTEETAKHETDSEGSYSEETSNSISGRQDVIDEEILDLWIETAMSEDADGIEQEEEPEPEQHMDTEIEPLNEEQGDITSAKEEEQLVESNPAESQLASDTEMSSSTVESGFFTQSLSEWDAQSSETQLLRSESAGSLQGIQDMLVGMSESADISEFSAPPANSESKDASIEETAEGVPSHLKEETRFYPDSEATSPNERNLNQESDESQEKTDEETVETASTESRSQKEIDIEVTNGGEKTDWKDSESMTKTAVFFQLEETKFEDEPPKRTVSGSPDEIKHTESGSGSEASLEEEISSMEPDLKDELPSPEEPQPGWSEAESLSELKVAEEPFTMSEDRDQVVAPLLDFTVQRSRIAVKNPRVRPPKDPRSLLHMPSVEPTPSAHVPVKAPIGVPLGGLGIGIKLPGLGAGFPVLKKTKRVVREENSQETLSQQEPEAKPEEKSDALQQVEAQPKPKWTPPRHPGFGNPLMSELKTKLKKTTQE